MNSNDQVSCKGKEHKFFIGDHVWIHRTDGSKRDGRIVEITSHPNTPNTLKVTLTDGSWMNVSEAEVTPFDDMNDYSGYLNKLKDLCVDKNLHLSISPDATFQVWAEISDETYVVETANEVIEVIECLGKLEKWREKF